MIARKLTVPSLSAAGGFLLGQIIWLFPALAKDAVIGWANEQISIAFGIEAPTAHAVVSILVAWVLPTIGGVLIVFTCVRASLWLARAPIKASGASDRVGKSATDADPAVAQQQSIQENGAKKYDEHLVQLRTDAKRLVRMLGGYGSPQSERQDVFERLQRIDKSDHAAWLDDSLFQARVDFVHWCLVAQSLRERDGPTFRSREECEETLFLLKDAAKRLEAGLSGHSVPPPAELPSAPNVAERDIWLMDALRYIVRGYWDNSEFPEFASNDLSLLGGALDQVHQAAFDGKLPIWGIKIDGRLQEPIDQSEWRDLRIDWFSAIKGNAEELQLKTGSQFSNDFPRYLSPMTSKAKVIEVWGKQKQPPQ